MTSTPPQRRGLRLLLRPRLAPWPLLAWIGLLSVVNAWWVRENVLRHPPPWDQAAYLRSSLRFHHALADGGLRALAREVATHETYAAPLFPLSMLPLYRLLGEERSVAYLVNGFYLAVMLLGVHAIGRLLGGARVGVLAAGLLSTFGAVVSLSRDLQMDLPAVAWLPWACYGLIRSDGFRQRRGSLLFGAGLGLALLTKTMSGAFLLGPALLTLARGTRSRDSRWRSSRNALLAVSLAALVAAVWWGPRLGQILWYLTYYGFGAGADLYDPMRGASWFSPRNVFYYTLAIVNLGASVPLAVVLVLVALERASRLRSAPHGQPRFDPHEALLLCWLLAGYFVLTLVRNKAADRYTLGLLPPIALLGAWWVCSIRAPALRAGLSAGLLAAGLATLGALTWPGRWATVVLVRYRPPLSLLGPRPAPRWWRSWRPFPPAGSWALDEAVSELDRWWFDARLVSLQAETAQPLRPAFGDSTPDYVRGVYAMLLRREPEQPALRAFVSQVEAGRTSRLGVFRSVLASEEFRQRPARVLVVADHPFVNAATLGYRAEAARLRLAFVNGTSVPTSAGADLFDAVVVRVGGPKEWLLAAATAWVRELESPGSRFEPLPGSFEAPDASELHVFVARPEAG